MWDREDREEDEKNLERGAKVLDQGHETPASTVIDADWDEILEMPSNSPWPPVLAFAVVMIFVFILLKVWVAAAICAFVSALVLAAWHSKEPIEA
jgi:cytochrome c oxidase subunit 1/cytochrome c oxidase subunit I+III